MPACGVESDVSADNEDTIHRCHFQGCSRTYVAEAMLEEHVDLHKYGLGWLQCYRHKTNKPAHVLREASNGRRADEPGDDPDAVETVPGSGPTDDAVDEPDAVRTDPSNGPTDIAGDAADAMEIIPSGSDCIRMPLQDVLMPAWQNGCYVPNADVGGMQYGLAGVQAQDIWGYDFDQMSKLTCVILMWSASFFLQISGSLL